MNRNDGEALATEDRVTGSPVVSQRGRIGAIFAKQGIFIAFLLFMVGFALFSDKFLTGENLMTVVRQAAIIGAMAVGVTVVVISGNLDLSVGSMLSFSTVLVVDLHDKLGPAPAIFITFGATLVIGAVNGLLVGYLRLNSLIVTLGMLSAIQGLILIYTGGKNVDIVDQEETWFAIFGRGEILGIATPILIFLGLALVLHVIMIYSPFGRRVYAVGGNPTAAVFSGVSRSRIVFKAYLISAVTVAFAAIILGSRVMGSQNNVGQGYELLVLAGVILGGTSLLGGSGSVLKTVIGVLILGFIQNGLLLLGFAYYAQWIVTWVVIILAVWLDVAAKRRRLFSPIA